MEVVAKNLGFGVVIGRSRVDKDLGNGNGQPVKQGQNSS